MGVSFKKNDVIHKYAGYASADIYVSDKYLPSKTYNVGDYCIYKNKLWKKIGATEVGITPTEGTSWTQTKLSEEIEAVSGNLAQLKRLDLLWTNTSPTSQISTMTINVGLTNYKAIIIEYILSVGNSSVLLSGLIPTNLSAKFVITDFQTSATEVPSLVTRAFSIQGDNLSMESGVLQRTNSNSRATNNNVVIPTKIYGMK